MKAKIQAQALKHIKSKKSKPLDLINFFKDYIQVLKTEKIKKTDIVCELQKGVLEDTSLNTQPNLFAKNASTFDNSEKDRTIPSSPLSLENSKLWDSMNYFKNIKRSKSIVNISELLEKHTNVNLYGNPGIGKTTFIHQLKYELIRRPGYYTDGIYVFNLSEVSIYSKSRNVKDLMFCQLGQKFGHNMNSYFKDKKMLIIFDEFDLICHGKEVRYPTYLF